MPLKPKAHRSSKAWFKHLPYFQLADTNCQPAHWCHYSSFANFVALFRGFPVCSDDWKCKNTTSNNKTGNYALFCQMFVSRCSTTALRHYHWFDLIWYSNFVCPGLPYWVWVYATVSSRECIVPLPPHQYSIQWLWSVCCYPLFICIILGVQIETALLRISFESYTLKLSNIWCRSMCFGTHLSTVWKLWHDCAATLQSCLLVEYLSWPIFFRNSGQVGTSVHFREDGGLEDYEKIDVHTCILSVAPNASA